MQITHYSYQILIKLEFSGQIYEKFGGIKFHENLSSGNRIVPCGRTDVQSLFLFMQMRLKTFKILAPDPER
jgi:hypothetical protein